MARHGGGRGWYGKVLGAALGVTLLAAGASVWTAQAGALGGSSPKTKVSAAPGSAVKQVAVTIVHASDKGRAASTSPSTTAPTPSGPPKSLTCCGSTG